MRWQPTLRVAAPYYDEPAYIDALAASTRATLAKLDFEPEVILASYPRHPPEPISTRAIPITAIARRRRDFCANRSASNGPNCA